MVSTCNTNFWSPPNCKNNNKKATKHTTNSKVKHKNKLEQQKLSLITDHMIQKEKKKSRPIKKLEHVTKSKITGSKSINEHRSKTMPIISKDLHNIKEDTLESRETTIDTNEEEDLKDHDRNTKKDTIPKDMNTMGRITKEIKQNNPYTDSPKDKRRNDIEEREEKAEVHTDTIVENKQISSQSDKQQHKPENQQSVYDHEKAFTDNKQSTVEDKQINFPIKENTVKSIKAQIDNNMQDTDEHKDQQDNKEDDLLNEEYDSRGCSGTNRDKVDFKEMEDKNKEKETTTTIDQSSDSRNKEKETERQENVISEDQMNRKETVQLMNDVQEQKETHINKNTEIDTTIDSKTVDNLIFQSIEYNIERERRIKISRICAR